MFEFEFKRLEMNKIGKLRCGEAIEFEFEFKGLEMNKIGKSRCEEGIDVSQAQRSGPLLLVFNNNLIQD